MRHQSLRRLHDGPRTRVDLRVAPHQPAGVPFGPPRRRQRRRIVLPGQHDPQVWPALRPRPLLRPLDRSLAGLGLQLGGGVQRHSARRRARSGSLTCRSFPCRRRGWGIWVRSGIPFAGPGGQVRRGLRRGGGPQGQRSRADRLFHQQRTAAGRRAQAGARAPRVAMPVEGAADRAAGEEVRDHRGLQYRVEHRVCLVRRGGRSSR